MIIYLITIAAFNAISATIYFSMKRRVDDLTIKNKALSDYTNTAALRIQDLTTENQTLSYNLTATKQKLDQAYSNTEKKQVKATDETPSDKPKSSRSRNKRRKPTKVATPSSEQ